MAKESFCKSCGTVITKNTTVCPVCDARLTTADGKISDKSRVVAAALALLLGGFGAHKFYIEKISLGR